MLPVREIHRPKRQTTRWERSSIANGAEFTRTIGLSWNRHCGSNATRVRCVTLRVISGSMWFLETIYSGDLTRIPWLFMR